MTGYVRFHDSTKDFYFTTIDKLTDKTATLQIAGSTLMFLDFDGTVRRSHSLSEVKEINFNL